MSDLLPSCMNAPYILLDIASALAGIIFILWAFDDTPWRLCDGNLSHAAGAIGVEIAAFLAVSIPCT